MATVRKTITLTDQQDDWIKAQVEGGHYTNDSEYIRDLIRREQERGAEIEAVRAALIEGDGKPKRFVANAIKRKLRRAHSGT
jgi:antitoxin ParD1/3/4